MLHSIGIICLALILPGQGTPSFGSVSIGPASIWEGTAISLSCEVNNLTDDYSISWYRNTIAGERTVIYKDGMLINNDLGREAEAYQNYNVLDIVIKQVRGRNLGHLLNGNNYTCEVTLKSTGEAVLVSSGVILTANYLPGSLYPICESCDFLSDSIGSNVTISCVSEPGQPNIKLRWSKNGERVIENLQTIMEHSLLYLKYTFILESQDLESNYSCTNTVQSCKLTSHKAGVDKSSPTMLLDTDTSQPPGTVIVPTNETFADSRTIQSSNLTTVIGVSIGVVLFLVSCLLICVCLYRKKHEKRRPTTTFREQSTNEFTSDASNHVYAQATNQQKVESQDVPPSNTNLLNEDIPSNLVESGTIENSIYVGYNSD